MDTYSINCKDKRSGFKLCRRCGKKSKGSDPFIPHFLADIQTLRERYPAPYWVQGRKLDSDAEALCRRWRIEGLYWVVWLVEHWNPDQVKLPPIDLRDKTKGSDHFDFPPKSWRRQHERARKVCGLILDRCRHGNGGRGGRNLRGQTPLFLTRR